MCCWLIHNTSQKNVQLCLEFGFGETEGFQVVLHGVPSRSCNFEGKSTICCIDKVRRVWRIYEHQSSNISAPSMPLLKQSICVQHLRFCIFASGRLLPNHVDLMNVPYRSTPDHMRAREQGQNCRNLPQSAVLGSSNHRFKSVIFVLCLCSNHRLNQNTVSLQVRPLSFADLSEAVHTAPDR